MIVLVEVEGRNSPYHHQLHLEEKRKLENNIEPNKNVYTCSFKYTLSVQRLFLIITPYAIFRS